MENPEDPFAIASEDVFFRSAYNLPHELVFETPAYPRYNFDQPLSGPPVVPPVYANNPSLFSASVHGPSSIGGASGDESAPEPSIPSMQDFVQFFQPVRLSSLGLSRLLE